MSWGATVATGFVGGLLGGAGMFVLGNVWVKWYRISSFEGKAGFFVIGMAFLGLVGGVVLALIAARIAAASMSPGWTTQLGVGCGSVLAALLATLTISYVGADLEPELGGRGIEIAWEVRLPRAPAPGSTRPQFVAFPDGNPDPRTWPDEKLKLQLVAVAKRNSQGSRDAIFDRAAMREEEGQWILPARTPLFTSKGELCVNLFLGERKNSVTGADGFWPPISPRTPNIQPAGGAWSAWMRTMDTRNAASDDEAVMYRFRCEKPDAPGT